MKKIAGLIVSGVCAASAFAQPGNKTQIDMKARLSGTNEWLDVVDVATGVNDAVNIEIGLFLYRDSGYRMGGTTCTIMTNSWNDGDSYEIVDHPENSTHPDGREPYFNFGGQAQTGYITGIDLGRLRIAAQNNPNDIIGGGISIKAHSYSFDTSDGLLAYRFNIRAVNPDPGYSHSRVIVSDAPLNHISGYYVFTGPYYSGTASIIASLIPTDVATIKINWLTCFAVTGDGDTAVCPFAPAAFTVTPSVAGSYTYQWQFKGGQVADWTNLANGSNSVGSQFILNASGARTRILIVDHDPVRWPTGAAGQFRCLVSQDCGSVYSAPAALTICGADYNCDGFVTGEDFDTYHEAFANGLPDTDFDGDGFVTGDDFDAYVLAFEAGC